MKIGVIGYKRHANKHIEIIKKKFPLEKLIIYHPFKKDKSITNSFSFLENCDYIIISSPTKTHLFYIRKLAKCNFQGFIYLEKPGFNSIEESIELERLQNQFNLKITIGYHMPFESKIKKLKEIIDEKDTGEIISFDSLSSKGISYSEWFLDDWRSDDQLSVAHTGLCHALSIFFYLFDKSLSRKINSKIFFNSEVNAFDVALATSNDSKPIFKAIFSWGAPRVDSKLEILTTNKLINIRENKLEVRSPRDSFDDKFNYVNPKTSYSKSFLDEGLEPSLTYFFERNRDYSSGDLVSFKKALEIGRICLNSEVLKDETIQID